MKAFKKIGILTSGGDAPGMNAAVRAVTRAALNHGVEVMGIYKGYSGLINKELRPLSLRDVSNMMSQCGSGYSADSGIHTGGIATGGQHADSSEFFHSSRPLYISGVFLTNSY